MVPLPVPAVSAVLTILWEREGRAPFSRSTQDVHVGSPRGRREKAKPPLMVASTATDIVSLAGEFR